jgi:hypothetical protein
MSTGGGNLFGTRIIWLRIVAIAVIFTVWSQIISCNAANDSKSREAKSDSLATSSSAISYCETSVRKQHSIHQQFRITDTDSTKMAARGYRVVLRYEFFNGGTQRMTTGSETCNLEWRGSDWRSGIRF